MPMIAVVESSVEEEVVGGGGGGGCHCCLFLLYRRCSVGGFRADSDVGGGRWRLDGMGCMSLVCLLCSSQTNTLPAVSAQTVIVLMLDNLRFSK